MSIMDDVIVNLDKIVEESRSIIANAVNTMQAMHQTNENLRMEILDLERELMKLRAALAHSKDPCVYCSLPAEEQIKCTLGFPGCGRADDQMGCPNLFADYELRETEKHLEALLQGLTIPLTERQFNEKGVSSLHERFLTLKYTLGENGVFVDFSLFKPNKHYINGEAVRTIADAGDRLNRAYDGLDALGRELANIKFDEVKQYKAIDARNSYDKHVYVVECVSTLEDVVKLSRVEIDEIEKKIRNGYEKRYGGTSEVADGAVTSDGFEDDSAYKTPT